MRATEVMTGVLNDLQQDLEFIVPHPDRLMKLFNDAQQEIAVEQECIFADYEHQLSPYLCESGYAIFAVTSDHQISIIMGSEDTDDYYNGWLLTNDTLKKTSLIVDSIIGDPATDTYVIHLARGMSGQAASDLIKVERFANYIDTHWSLIRPYSKMGVYWGDYELCAVPASEIKEMYRKGNTTGTPRYFAQENQRIWIYPQPTSLDMVRISGYRLPADCFKTTTTSNGFSSGYTIISTGIPKKTDNYYKGCKVEILSGTSLGEIQTVAEYDASEDTLYFESPFSAQIASSVSIELHSLLPENYKRAVEEYMKARLLEKVKEFSRIAEKHEARYLAFVEQAETQTTRRDTSFVSVGGSRRSGFSPGIHIMENDN